MIKRRKQTPKGKVRVSRPHRVIVSIPGGRKAELVREADPGGRPVIHGRTIDTLTRMLKAGTITAAMHDAARDFQAHFAIAAYDTTPFRSMVRVSVSRNTSDLTDNQVAARQRVFQALQALGGIGSPGGVVFGTSSVSGTACANGRCVKAGTGGRCTRMKRPAC